MTGGYILLLLITEFIAIVFVVLGYLILVKKKRHLIAGYDPTTCNDPEGLAAWVGKSLFALGIAAALLFVVMLILPGYSLILFLAYTAGVVPIGAIIVAVGARRYDRIGSD
ncbi:MAG: DUF3784 domain-containing protein [Methanocalculus sp. MSAO_Arc2]|uniref:DUF3784 domain-containing protein n=1 Tax=Methanocalculus sp. MSAO_Arc2 TaxID=2293855 RepID=UPI000FF5875A|nr:MAG: DUF3784 domain-containing protein [Methanocalculus sp. MSAO_Arc2]